MHDYSRDLFSQIPDAVAILSPQGLVLAWNAAAAAMFGHPSDAVVGRDLVDVLAGSSDELGRHLRAARSSGHEVAEIVTTRHDRSLLNVSVSTKVVPSLGTGDSYALCTMRDVTHLKALRDAKWVEARYRDLLESTPDAIVIANGTGRVVYANLHAEQLFGYSRTELIGRSVEVLLPSRYRTAHVQHRRAFFAQPRHREMGAGLTLHGQRRDGTEFPVEISLSPIETDEGLLVASAIRDVTERRRIEQTLQQANRLKSEFLANMSHELRTPLNGILGLSEVLVDERVGPLNPKQREFLNDILGCGNHLLQLINDVLDLSKIEAGKVEVHAGPVRLSEAVEDACAVVAPLAQSKRIEMHCMMSQDVGVVQLDAQKLRQVLLNLLSNAVKFTNDGGRIDVSTGFDADGELELQVRDSGIGIRAEDMAHLFVEFHQLDSGNDRRYPGSGLGLALTRKLVELQGGRIEVSSEFGRGTTFTVHLPHAVVEA